MIRFSIFFGLYLLGFNSPCSAQEFTPEEQREVDSLTFAIAHPSHDTSLASAYNHLSVILGRSDWDTLFALSNRTVQLAERGIEKSNDPSVIRSFKKSLSSALSHLGYVHNFKGNYELALEYDKRSIKISEELGDKSRLPTLYLNIGALYYDMGDIPMALDYFSRSARISEDLKDLDGMAYAYNNMGSVHREQGDPASALPYFEQTRQICELIDDKPGLAMSHDNIAHILMKNPSDTTALHHYNKALQLRESIGDREGIASSLLNIATVYERDGKQLDLAKGLLKKALGIQEEIGDKQGQAMSCVEIAVVAQKMGKGGLNEAIVFGERGLALAQELGDPLNIIAASTTLSKAYQSKGKFEEALDMYVLYMTMLDSVHNEENKRKVIRQQMQYDYDKKEALLAAEQEKKDALAAEQLHRREVYLTAATAVTFLLGIISLILFFFYRSRTKANNALEKKNTEISEQNAIIEEKNLHITDSIRYAERLQAAILPKPEMFAKHFSDFNILYLPKDIVSGDFYWMEELNGMVFLAVADCTGHGVPGAMVSMVGFQGLNKAVLEEKLTSPAAILQRLSDHVEEAFEKSGGSVKDGMDICLCAIDPQKRTVSYAGAHNALWVLTSKEELPEANLREEENGLQMFELKADRRSIGGFLDAGTFSETRIELNVGDRLFLFSDGFADQFGGPQGKKMGSKRMRETLRQMALTGDLSQLESTFTDWKGEEEQVDDVTVIAVAV